MHRSARASANRVRRDPLVSWTRIPFFFSVHSSYLLPFRFFVDTVVAGHW